MWNHDSDILNSKIKDYKNKFPTSSENYVPY